MQTFPVKGQRLLKDRSIAQIKALTHQSVKWKNHGVAAGQTIPHLHMHLIPRYAGDVPDPRCGVRWLIPGKADCWSPR